MNKELLSEVMEKSGKPIEYYAYRLGISANGLRNKVKGITEFKGSEIKTISAELHLTDKQRNEIFFN